MPGSETKEEKMFFMETIKRIIREMPKVEKQAGWCVLEDEAEFLSAWYDPAVDPGDPLNPANPANPLHDDD